MRVLVQRVRNANVTVQGRQVAAIQQGLLLFVAVAVDDELADVEYLASKVLNLRIFEDEKGKMNLAAREINGQILSIPQFTLYANTERGNRPSFDSSAKPLKAKELWQRFNSCLCEKGAIVKQGIFGANMQVSLINDGPVTIWLDSKNK